MAAKPRLTPLELSKLAKARTEPKYVVVVMPTRIPYSHNQLSFEEATLVKDRARGRGLDARIFPAHTVQQYTI